MEVALLIMAAGKSSRFGGEPKMLSKIGPNDESLFDISIQQMRTHISICHIHLVLNVDNKVPIMEEVHKVNNKYELCEKITYNIQEITPGRSKPWGTADAITSASSFMNTPFLLINSDDLYDDKTFRMISTICNPDKNYIVGFTLGSTLPDNTKANRGFISLNSDGKVAMLKERLNIEKQHFTADELDTQYVSVNLLLLQPSTLMSMTKDVEIFKSINALDYTIEALLPNFINALIQKGDLTMEIVKSPGKWMGVTYKADVNELKNLFANSVV
jgi:choline kinase